MIIFLFLLFVDLVLAGSSLRKQDVSGLNTMEIVQIVAGCVAIVGVIFLVYKYATWKPKKKAKRVRRWSAATSEESSDLINTEP